MKTVGLFEAKTKLSELLAEVEESRQPLIISRRGKPIAKVEPMETERPAGIWERRDAYLKRKGSWKKSLEVPERSLDNPPIWSV